MTHRTDTNPPSPIERATSETLHSILQNATHFYHENRVASQHGTTLPQFLRILALYLHDKSLSDWSHDLGIPDASDPEERTPQR